MVKSFNFSLPILFLFFFSAVAEQNVNQDFSLIIKKTLNYDFNETDLIFVENPKIIGLPEELSEIKFEFISELRKIASELNVSVIDAFSAEMAINKQFEFQDLNSMQNPDTVIEQIAKQTHKLTCSLKGMDDKFVEWECSLINLENATVVKHDKKVLDLSYFMKTKETLSNQIDTVLTQIISDFGPIKIGNSVTNYHTKKLGQTNLTKWVASEIETKLPKMVEKLVFNNSKVILQAINKGKEISKEKQEVEIHIDIFNANKEYIDGEVTLRVNNDLFLYPFKSNSNALPEHIQFSDVQVGLDSQSFNPITGLCSTSSYKSNEQIHFLNEMGFRLSAMQKITNKSSEGWNDLPKYFTEFLPHYERIQKNEYSASFIRQNLSLMKNYQINSNKNVFNDGDNLSFYINSKQPSQMSLFYLLGDGNVVRVFPDRCSPNVIIPRNSELIIPLSDDYDIKLYNFENEMKTCEAAILIFNTQLFNYEWYDSLAPLFPMSLNNNHCRDLVSDKGVPISEFFRKLGDQHSYNSTSVIFYPIQIIKN